MSAELFRVVDTKLKSFISCKWCARRAAYSIMNRVFGNSDLKCEFCGVSIKSGDEGN